MAEFNSIQKNKLAQKLNRINVNTEKDILNLKVSKLKEINEIEDIQNLTLKDVEMIWLMQDAIGKDGLLKFFTNSE
ncbi:MAG: hypothetical protein IJH76_05295 [Clostridia bacterium]|nr:hypothetical protein [Clostridia bacterium]